MFDLTSIRDWSADNGLLVITGAGTYPSDEIDPQNVVLEFCDATYFLELDDLPFYPRTADDCLTLIEQFEPTAVI